MNDPWTYPLVFLTNENIWSRVGRQRTTHVWTIKLQFFFEWIRVDHVQHMVER